VGKIPVADTVTPFHAKTLKSNDASNEHTLFAAKVRTKFSHTHRVIIRTLQSVNPAAPQMQSVAAYQTNRASQFTL
jgi:hypothetical protein